MKQIIQSFSDGIIKVVEVPIPALKADHILIQSITSLISSGTERMLIDFGKANPIQKAYQQQDKLKEVLQKVKTDGIYSTYDAVKTKLDTPIPMGYCNVGKIIEVGEGVNNFKVGDRVISNGNHAEFVLAPKNLVAKVPEQVPDDEAVFTVISSIGLQGIRLANPTLGETFVVSGLGLIGLITCQLLKANGCKVFGLDPDKEKCKMAESFGIKTLLLGDLDDPAKWCVENNNSLGVDGFIITANTSSNQPVDIAAKACRKRGRIVLVGVTGLNLKRDLFYKKELSFQVSCSYGPGRYDMSYEKYGNDYPIGYVRWTEQRNFEAILEKMSSKTLICKSLVSHKFDIQDATKAYALLSKKVSCFGILIKYKTETLLKKDLKRNDYLNLSRKEPHNKKDNNNLISFIGCGNYASRVLIPAFSKAGAKFDCISSNDGIVATHIAKKYKFSKVCTDNNDIFLDENIRNVVITTRHDSHGELVLKALESGKNVFVEKPLCLNLKELESIEKFFNQKKGLFDEKKLSKPILMIGFNRRFSPLILNLKTQLDKLSAPKSIIYTINSGFIDNNHWIHDPLIGGGRLIGEACHFIDLLRYLIGNPIKNKSIKIMKDSNNLLNTFSLQLDFEDGSLANINYFSNGNKNFPKERIDIFCDGNVMQIDNFRKIKTWGSQKNINNRAIFQDKGQINCARAFINAIENNTNSPISLVEIFEVQKEIISLSNS